MHLLLALSRDRRSTLNPQPLNPKGLGFSVNAWFQTDYAKEGKTLDAYCETVLLTD